ncbi:MAG TPA: adenylyltransferase/cytidyltransferase family protein [Candidatus Paceibacterota bacterium]|nr:adenylyltransferase/cytidyltransferase family protein [Candidatus Paceibacterota bacterium]
MKKYNVGFTCGAFDLCHAGHMLMFKDCKEVCDYLIVALQTDPTLDPGYREKVKNKPVMSFEERRIILQSIKYVDEIVYYSTEADLYDLLKIVRYDVRIIGADWKGKKFTGWDLPYRVHFNGRDHGFSTTELRERIHMAEELRILAAQNVLDKMESDATTKIVAKKSR